MNPPFSQAQIAALRQLDRLWSPATRFVLIGATAIRCQRAFDRTTYDIDITVAVSLDQMSAGLDTLPGWSQHSRKEHTWHGPDRVDVDVLPSGPDLLAAGQIEWKDGHVMSLIGFEHALSNTVEIALARDLSIAVATLPVVALLKMVAYLDRPHERRRDLTDIGFLLEEYLSTTTIVATRTRSSTGSSTLIAQAHSRWGATWRPSHWTETARWSRPSWPAPARTSIRH